MLMRGTLICVYRRDRRILIAMERRQGNITVLRPRSPTIGMKTAEYGVRGEEGEIEEHMQ